MSRTKSFCGLVFKGIQLLRALLNEEYLLGVAAKLIDLWTPGHERDCCNHVPALVQNPICARASISPEARFVIDREGLGMIRDCVSFNNLHRLRTFDNLHWATAYNFVSCLQCPHKPFGKIIFADVSHYGQLRVTEWRSRGGGVEPGVYAAKPACRSQPARTSAM